MTCLSTEALLYGSGWGRLALQNLGCRDPLYRRPPPTLRDPVPNAAGVEHHSEPSPSRFRPSVCPLSFCCHFPNYPVTPPLFQPHTPTSARRREGGRGGGGTHPNFTAATGGGSNDGITVRRSLVEEPLRLTAALGLRRAHTAAARGHRDIYQRRGYPAHSPH